MKHNDIHTQLLYDALKVIMTDETISNVLWFINTQAYKQCEYAIEKYEEYNAE